MIRACRYASDENGGEPQVSVAVTRPHRWRIRTTLHLDDGTELPIRIDVRDKMMLTQVVDVAIAEVRARVAELTAQDRAVQRVVTDFWVDA